MEIITIHLNKQDLLLAAASIFLIGVCAGILLIYGLQWIQGYLELRRLQRMNYDRRMTP